MGASGLSSGLGLASGLNSALGSGFGSNLLSNLGSGRLSNLGGSNLGASNYKPTEILRGEMEAVPAFVPHPMFK